VPWHQDDAVVAATAFMNGEKRETQDKHKRDHDPGTEHHTHWIAKLRQPALSNAMSQHDAQLQLVFGRRAMPCPHKPVRSAEKAGYFTIACAMQMALTRRCELRRRLPRIAAPVTPMASSWGKRPLQSTGEAAIGAAPRGSAIDAAPDDRDRVRATLMARAQTGDGAAYRHLLEDITPFIRALASRSLRDKSEVEDAVQDVLLTVHVIRHTYDPGRPFAPWLTAIANRRIVDRLRSQGRLSLKQTLLRSKHETSSASEPNLEFTERDVETLRTAVEVLPSSQRQAIKMLKLGEMSLKEAAAASGMSIPALKVATHRALGTLRKILGNQRRST
jgi:RNA polymerase sigma factor (sigma-70 family)